MTVKYYVVRSGQSTVLKKETELTNNEQYLSVTIGSPMTLTDLPIGEYTVTEYVHTTDEEGKEIYTAITDENGGVNSWTFVSAISTTAETAAVVNGTPAGAELINRYTSGKYCIAVTKQWIVEGEVYQGADLPEIAVKLQRTTESPDAADDKWEFVPGIYMGDKDNVVGNETDDNGKVNYILLNKDNNWSAVAVGQDQMDAAGNRYSYRWVEGTVVNGTFTDGAPTGWIEGASEKVQSKDKDGTDLVFLTKLKNYSGPHKEEVVPYEGTGDLGGVQVGDQITYEITYQNYKDVDADITIKDKLDDHVKYISSQPAGTHAGTTDEHGGTVTWTLLGVPAGTAGKVSLTVEVLESALVSKGGEGKVVNGGETATVQVGNDTEKSLEVVTNPVPEEPHKREIAPDVGIGELCPVDVGDEITYEISYQNYKKTPATITIEDQLDAHVEFVSASDGGVHSDAATDGSGGKVTWTLENVPAGKSGMRRASL